MALATSNNGIASIGDFSDWSIVHLVFRTYLYYGGYALFPTTYHPFIATELYTVLVVITLYHILKIAKAKKIQLINTILLVLALVLMPFGSNVVYLSQRV